MHHGQQEGETFHARRNQIVVTCEWAKASRDADAKRVAGMRSRSTLTYSSIVDGYGGLIIINDNLITTS